MAPKITYSSLPSEIKNIANASLGLGVLKSLFTYSNTYHLMIKISDGAFIGFALYHFEKRRYDDGEALVKGVIDCVCVAPAYRKDGFGTLLTFGVLRKMSAYGADRVEIMLKSPASPGDDGEPGVPLSGSPDMLRSLGFSIVETFENYYERGSRKYGYDCILCGNRPDSCHGILFAIDA